MIDKKVLIAKNNTLEKPGLLKGVLLEKDIPFQIVDLDKGEKFPNPRNYLAVVVLGGPDSANDTTPKMQQEIDFVKEVLDIQLPYFGVCLGMQVLVKAAGGEVYNAPFKEIGCTNDSGEPYLIKLTEEGIKDQLFQKVPHSFYTFHLHGETVELGPDTILLGTGRDEYQIKNQVVRVGNSAYGFQGHLELTDAILMQLMQKDRDLISK